MIFKELTIKGTFVVELKRLEDDRGFFARTWCQKEFKDNGLNPNFVQANTSFNMKRGTLRGMHYQVAPYEETKLVRCTKGAIYDVIIDLRKESSTFGKWVGVELSSENHKALYVPQDFAHGFITLQDNTEIIYQVSQFYAPGSEQGIRFDDPAFRIEWPLDVQVISDKDKNWPDYSK